MFVYTVILKVPTYLFSCLEKGFFFSFFRFVFCKHALHNFFMYTYCKRGRAISALPPKSLMDCIDKYLAREHRVVSCRVGHNYNNERERRAFDGLVYEKFDRQDIDDSEWQIEIAIWKRSISGRLSSRAESLTYSPIFTHPLSRPLF